jgi:hypothetical protein
MVEASLPLQSGALLDAVLLGFVWQINKNSP